MENKWEGKYILNIDKIDQQHKTFFDLWNTETKQVDKQDETEMIFIIEKLENYLKDHLEYEEELLRESNYYDLENHIEEHKFFIQKINSLKQELTYYNPLVFEKTTLFMKQWFLSHILISDKKYQETVIAFQEQKEEE